MRKLSLEQAKAQYVHRYTVEHVPNWARKIRSDGTYYAPQFRSDREWYDNTIFPGEPGVHGNCKHCYTSGQTWPMGQSLPFQPSSSTVHVKGLIAVLKGGCSMSAAKYRELQPHELAALRHFANEYGRRWKATLNEVYWYNARLYRPTGERGCTMGETLHGLRNSHGPTWLAGFKLSVVKAQVAA